MTEPRPALVVHLPDGSVELRAWPAWAARVVDELVVLAGPEIPEGPERDRLLQPGATDDPEEAAEWRKRAHPELFALIASARDVVAADLAAADRDPRGGIRRVGIPRGHVPAWIAAINAARLRLGVAHDVDADAMSAPFEDLPDEQRAAVVRIDLLGDLQYRLIASADPERHSGERPE